MLVFHTKPHRERVRARIKRHLVKAAVAGLLTATAWGDVWIPAEWGSRHWPGYLPHVIGLAQLAALPVIGDDDLVVLRRWPRPRGFPRFEATAIATFALSWLLLEVAPSAWRRFRHHMEQPLDPPLDGGRSST